MLVRPLKIHVRRIREIRAPFQYRVVGHAGIEPNIEYVGDLLVLIRFRAEQISIIELEPDIDTAPLHAQGDLLHELLGVRVQLAGLPVQIQSNRYAPASLPGNTPIGAVRHHTLYPRLAPIRIPGDLFYLFSGGRTQTRIVHTDEPLRRRTKNNR